MDDIEKIKSKLDIVDVIGERIPLKKAGRNFKTPCPFHGEKTASFVVSPERQIWHCFGCQKGGDMFTFLEEYENITFAEALRELAAKAGVTLTRSAARSDREKKQELIYSLNHLAQQFYNFLLLSHPAGKNALKYLTDERKLSIPLIKTFMLGYAPEGDALAKYLIGKKKYTEEDLVLAGLAYQKGKYVSDFFRHRIIFPIIDHRGNTVAFSGRQLDPNSYGGKYVNTRETPVYVKGDTLYGLNLAKDSIKSEGKVIIVEGEFDVITSHKEGITNIVAVKGTALTDNQIKLLKRFTQKFAFCFDTDSAGTEAQRRSIQLIEHEGITATVIVPPQGKDPDELLNENPVEFKKAVKNDKNVYDFVIDTALAEYDPTTSDGKKGILSRTLSYLASIENQVVKEHYMKKLADSIGTSIGAVTQEADKVKKPQAETTKINSKSSLPREEVLEIYLLSLIFQSSDPKKALLVARSVLDGVELSTIPLEKVLVALENYQQPEVAFSVSEFTKFLPAELHIPFDTAYLAPISEFADREHFEREIEKTATSARSLSVKKKLQKLAESIKEAEAEKDTEQLEKYEADFDKFSKLLSK
ncbi:MAG TPA: DNA primase [Patescibacteria group bacterium]|nr:DNA primase [Patescibacteria group bacterium]